MVCFIIEISNVEIWKVIVNDDFDDLNSIAKKKLILYIFFFLEIRICIVVLQIVKVCN